MSGSDHHEIRIGDHRMPQQRRELDRVASAAAVGVVVKRAGFRIVDNPVIGLGSKASESGMVLANFERPESKAEMLVILPLMPGPSGLKSRVISLPAAFAV